jgi:DNA-binding LacI/PurR family transcriptional regulator
MVDTELTADPKQSDEKIKALIEKSPGVLVIEGRGDFPFELLSHYTGRLIFIDIYETDQDYLSTRILSDYYEGGRMAVEHFLQAGHTKVVYFGHQVMPEHKTQLTLLAGARQAFRDHNLPEANLVITDASADEATLDETLTQAEKPLAIFCHGDSRATSIYAAARRLGLRIPEDISVIGYYNTPWCEVFDPHLSSISIREEEMAAQVVETILTGTDRKVFMKPKLIVRNSTRTLLND